MSENYSVGIDPSVLAKAPDEKWTDKYPGMDKSRVSYESMTSPEFHELEREAVFRRNWLYAGRAEWVDRPGRFFTKEYEVLRNSIIVVHGHDGNIRAFYNVCPHRGNKLVWKDEPGEPIEGVCKRFYCKYHGLGYGTDGKLEVLTDRESWFGEPGRELALAEVPLQSWNGFLFVNMNRAGPEQTLREFLGDYYWAGFDWPFEKLTERFVARGVTQCNWKGLMDAFNEIYHGVYVHKEAFPYLQKMSFDALQAMHVKTMALVGKHGFYMSPRNPQGLFVTDIERISQCTGTGPQYPAAEDLTQLPPAANPIHTDDWGTSSHFIFPNIQIQFYYPNWYLVYQYWPLAYNRMRFEIDCHYQPSKNFSELMSHYGHVATFWDAALQDINNLEATQKGLEMGVFQDWPLTDQELMIRGFHRQVYDHVARYREERGRDDTTVRPDGA